MKKKFLITILFFLLSWPALTSATETSLNENYQKFLLANLSFSFERSQATYQNIKEKIGEQNKNYSSLETDQQLKEIQQVLERGQKNFNLLRSTSTQLDWPTSKRLTRGIIQDIRLSHKKMSQLVKLLDK